MTTETIPSADSGNNGKVLGTVGGAFSWVTPPAGAQGPQGGPQGFRTYAGLTAGATSYASTPDVADLRLTGKLSLRALILPNSWATGVQQNLFGRWTLAGNNRSWMLVISTTGLLGFGYSANGTTPITINSAHTVPSFVPTAVTHEPLWLRADADPNVGGATNVTFYYSWDGSAWIAFDVGAQVNATPGPWFAGTSPLQTMNVGAASFYAGRLYVAEVWDASGGGGFASPVLTSRLDARALNPASPLTTFADGLGHTYTPAAGFTVANDQLNDLDFQDATIRPQRLMPGLTDGLVVGQSGGTVQLLDPISVTNMKTMLAGLLGQYNAVHYGALGDAWQLDNGAITSGSNQLTGTFTGAAANVGKLCAVVGAGSVLASGTTTANILTGITNNVLVDSGATFTESMRGACLWISTYKLKVWDVVDSHTIHFSRVAQLGAPSNPLSGTITSGAAYTISANLYTKIDSCTSTIATLHDNAGFTISSAARYVYGTDNAAAFTAWFAAIPKPNVGNSYGGRAILPAGWYLSSATLVYQAQGLTIEGDGGGYSNLQAKGATKLMTLPLNGAGAPPIILETGIAGSNLNGSARVRGLHLMGFYDTVGGWHIPDANAGKSWDVTISNIPQGYGLYHDPGGGNSQYWDHYNLTVDDCKIGIQGTALGMQACNFYGGVIDNMDNSLGVYPPLGSRGWYGGSGRLFGTRFQGWERLVDSGPVTGGSHAPQIELHGCRYEAFTDVGVWLEGWGSCVQGGSWSTSSTGGSAVTGIHVATGTLATYLRPGYYIPSNITMYSANTVTAIQTGVINVDDPQTYPPRIQSASRDLSARLYGCKLDGSDDTAALNAALVAAATAKCGVLLDGIATVTSPIEILTNAPLRGSTHRICGVKAGGGFSGSQLVRNWSTADWSGGESNHRIAPQNPILSGAHTFNHYPMIENIDLDPGTITNLALLSWVGAQETGWINQVTMHGGSVSDTNRGTWGLDLQAGTVAGSAINGIRVGQLTLYQLGWDRQVSITGQGSDVYIADFTGGGGSAWTAVVYVDNVGAIKFGRFDLNSPADTGAYAQIYLVNVFADFVIDELYVESTAMPSVKPMILTANTVGGGTTTGSRRSAPVIREASFYPLGGGPYYPNGFITDMYNTVPYDSGSIGTDTAGSFTQMSYDGYEIRATNIDGSRVRHAYKAST